MEQNSYYVKICGLTRPEDAVLAENLGAKFLGIVFHKYSPRRATVEQAREILLAVNAPIVFVFGYDDASDILSVWSQLSTPHTFLQIPFMHLDFEEIEMRLTAAKIFPSLSIDHFDERTEQSLERFPLFLLDSAVGTGIDGRPMAGGTGKTFEWEKAKHVRLPYLLAGGLNPDNLCEALRTLEPLGVDVSSGVESAPGMKDPEKLALFIRTAIKPQEYCRGR